MEDRLDLLALFAQADAEAERREVWGFREDDTFGPHIPTPKVIVQATPRPKRTYANSARKRRARERGIV